jgi:hypothetical protein
MFSKVMQTCASWVTLLRGQVYYDGLYRAMHMSHAFRGDTWRAHVKELRLAVPDLDQRVILDFGCGPKGGLLLELGENVIPYDPYCAQYSDPPWDLSFDVVFSSDVLEHMTLSQIKKFVNCARLAEPSFIFLVASTRPAEKTLPNGANAHLTVRPPTWWLGFVSDLLGDQYTAVMATANLLREDVTLCFERRVPTPHA